MAQSLHQMKYLPSQALILSLQVEGQIQLLVRYQMNLPLLLLFLVLILQALVLTLFLGGLAWIQAHRQSHLLKLRLISVLEGIHFMEFQHLNLLEIQFLSIQEVNHSLVFLLPQNPPFLQLFSILVETYYKASQHLKAHSFQSSNVLEVTRSSESQHLNLPIPKLVLVSWDWSSSVSLLHQSHPQSSSQPLLSARTDYSLNHLHQKNLLSSIPLPSFWAIHSQP